LPSGFGFSWTFYSNLYVFSGRNVKGDLLTDLYLMNKEKAVCLDCKSVKVTEN
jgi:hypothetical protein